MSGPDGDGDVRPTRGNTESAGQKRRQTTPSPAAPTAEADLRERMVACLVAARTRPRLAAATVDALLAGPLQRLVEQAAEARRLRETVARVEALAEELDDELSDRTDFVDAAFRIRCALDGEGTDG